MKDESFGNAVHQLIQFDKHPNVLLLGINLDGSFNKAFFHFLSDMAAMKHPQMSNSRSYMVRRSILITRWIRNIHAAFLKSVSNNIARAAALHSSYSRGVIDSIISNMSQSNNYC